MRKFPFHHRQGLTLIELLIAISISTGLILIITLFAIDITNFGLYLGDRLETERELEQMIREFVVEVRSMTTAENGSYPIAAADASSFTYFSDIDADGTIEQIRYFLNGTTLQRGLTEPSGTPPVYDPADETVRDIVKYIVPGADLFTYWPEGWIGETASLSSPINLSDIRLVRFKATVDKDPAVLPAGSTQSVHTTIRNLRGDI